MKHLGDQGGEMAVRLSGEDSSRELSKQTVAGSSCGCKPASRQNAAEHFTVRDILTEASSVRPELTAEGDGRCLALARV
jgi:hypothetical protein